MSINPKVKLIKYIILSQKKVSIVTVTYNQEGIISNTIDCILSQKANFDFELIIGEDCSTDATREIVLDYQKRFPDRVKVITSDSNVGIEKNYLRCYKSCQAEHIAICDGDDYWIDPLKLQKQIDFLENNKDFGLVGTNVKYFESNKNTFLPYKKGKGDFKIYDFKDVFIQNPLTSSTVLFRQKLLAQFLELYQENKEELKGFVDYSLWMFFSSEMKVAILDDITTVYRISDSSISQNTDFQKSWLYRKRNYEHFKFFSTYFKNIDATTLKKASHNRAIWYYRLVALNKDKHTFSELQKIFKENKDFVRYWLLTVSMKYNKFHFLSTSFEKIRARI